MISIGLSWISPDIINDDTITLFDHPQATIMVVLNYYLLIQHLILQQIWTFDDWIADK